MAIMRTNRLTSNIEPAKKTQTTKGVTVSNKKERRIIPATELEAQDAAFKSANSNYEAQMSTYKNAPKGSKSYANFGGGVAELSAAGLAQYNKSRPSSEPEATRIERPKAGGSEADFLKRVGTKGGYIGHVTYKEPVKPTAQKADWSKVELNKIPTKKATVTVPKGKLRDMAVEEFGEFNAPSMGTKVKTKRALTGGGDSGLVRAKNTGGSLKAAKRVVGEKTVGSRAYNKEKKQFEAFANQLPTGGRLSDSQFSPEIGRMKADVKGLAKEYRKEGNREGVKMMRAEAKQLGKAAKFSDKMYDKGRGDYFTRDMIQEYRSSSANPANQNTIERQQKLINSRK
jgi:hypothetical protein